MEGLIIFMFWIIAVSGVILVFRLIRKMHRSDVRSFLDGMTRDDYIARHGDAFVDGKVYCHRCLEKSRVWPKSYVLPGGVIVYRHICTECGEELFRSGAAEGDDFSPKPINEEQKKTALQAG